MDVDYRDTYAVSAGILFDDISSDQYLKKLAVKVEEVNPYESGAFYQRELPCLIEVISELESLPDVFIVDSYVYLNKNGDIGCGGHLFHHYEGKIPVIGVAKNKFKEDDFSSLVKRGDSAKPLFVTAIGMNQNEAAKLISDMHGEYRNPTLLKMVDSLCRESYV